jgi:lysophospholipase L1-like esterase
MIIVNRRQTLVAVAAALTLAGCGGGSDAPNIPPTPAPIAQKLTVRGEAMVLHGDTPATLRHVPAGILAVYGYDDTGRRIDYAQGADWTFANGEILRTSNSRIPDFDSYAYTAINAAGQFAFMENPRNPPLTINYIVYVDYASTVPDRTIEARGKTYQRVMCVGDSITAGADTVSAFYFNSDADSFCGLLRSYTSAHVDNFSVVGGTLAAAVPDLPQDLTQSQPQVVVIAFGMNDHMAGAAGLPAFRTLLDQIVTSLTDKGIDVILVGFLRQNTLWVLEDPTQTAAYNQAIADAAAAHGVPFVDTYTAFNAAEPAAETIERLTADFMHHPNQFGQRIYFSALLPYFLSQPVLASSVGEYVP